MYLKKELLASIRFMLTKPEQGVILGSKDNCIIECYYDKVGNSMSGRNTYAPDVESINKVLEEWAEKRIKFCGIVHSHPMSKISLSYADIEYGMKLCRSFEFDKVLMPIVIPESNEIYFYYVDRNGNDYKASLSVI